MRRLKVLRIINRLNIGGPTYNAAYLTKYLPEDQFETLLIGGPNEAHEESSEYILHQLGVSYQIVPSLQRAVDVKVDRRAYKEVKKIIEEFKPDIVHTHASKAGAVGRLAASACKVPVIIHTFHGHVFHSYFGKVKTNFYKNVERYLAKKSDAIIAISNQQKKELSEFHNICKSDKIEVVPLGLDLNRFQEDQQEKRTRFRSKYQVSGDEFALGIVGRLAPIKNHDLFLKSLVEVFQNCTKKLKVFIIGDGDLRDSLKAEVLALKLPAENVVFTSWIKDVDVAMAGLDLVALSSYNEGTPVSLIEAQAAGKTMVTTDVGGVCDVVKSNETGLIVPSNNVKAFSEALLKLIDQDEVRQSYEKEGVNWVMKKYHYDRLIKDVKDLYLKLANKKGLF